jgi:proteasome lid subunit RPN8/RPN11
VASFALLAPGDGAPETISYPPEVVARVAALCEADPGREACGFVVRRGRALEVVPIRNAADRYHAADPASFPRTSRDSYVMDPRDQLRVMRELDTWGGEIVAIWHSHVEAPAYFSEKDRSDALPGGVAAVPGAEYLVLGVRGGRVTDVKRYRLHAGAFAESDLA